MMERDGKSLTRAEIDALVEEIEVINQDLLAQRTPYFGYFDGYVRDRLTPEERRGEMLNAVAMGLRIARGEMVSGAGLDIPNILARVAPPSEQADETLTLVKHVRLVGSLVTKKKYLQRK